MHGKAKESTTQLYGDHRDKSTRPIRCGAPMYLSKYIIKLGIGLDWTCPRGADLRFLDLSNLDLGCADLSRASLTHANLMNTNLRCCRFSESNPTNPNLSGALLYGSDFSQAKLINANFSFVVLTDSCLYPRGDYLSTKFRNCHGNMPS